MNDLIDTTEMYLARSSSWRKRGSSPPGTHRRAPAPERPHGQPDRRPDGARRPADRRGRPAPAALRRGGRLATAVMRKHRLAECLLVDVIGLDYADVHEEACRWEHVMSEAVERKLLRCSAIRRSRRSATRSPASTPCAAWHPGRGDLRGLDSLTLLSTTATPEGRPVVVQRISEQLQENTDLLRARRPWASGRGHDGGPARRRRRHPRRPPLPAGVAHTCSSAPSTRT